MTAVAHGDVTGVLRHALDRRHGRFRVRFLESALHQSLQNEARRIEAAEFVDEVTPLPGIFPIMLPDDPATILRYTVAKPRLPFRKSDFWRFNIADIVVEDSQ